MRRFALAALAAALITTPALAQDKKNAGWYGALNLGYIATEDRSGTSGGQPTTIEFDNGYSIGAGLGYAFGNGFRLEADLSYGNVDLDRLHVGAASATLNADIDTYTATIGAYYDFKIGSSLSPYIGAGVGAVHEKTSGGTATIGGATVTLASDSGTNLTAYGEAGLGIKVSSNIEIVPSYRYQWIDDGSATFDDTTAHIFRAGLRYWF